jgi:NADH dehydrogenase
MRILVLGASGFVGRHTVPMLCRVGHEVVALARHPPAASDGVVPMAADALGAGVLERALAGCQAAVNLVGLNRQYKAETFERLHVELTGRLLAAAQAGGVGRLVQVSVLCARADPAAPYHDTKFRADAAVQQSPLAWTLLRPAIVFGEDDGFTTRIRALARTRLVPLPGGGQALHAPVHVDDLAGAIERCLAKPELAGRVLPLCGLRTLSYAQIVRDLAFRTGKRVATPAVPLWLVRLAAALTRGWRNPPVSPAQLTMLTEGMAQDTRASWEALGLEPRGFDAAHLA